MQITTRLGISAVYVILTREIDLLSRVLRRTRIERSLADTAVIYPSEDWLKLCRVLNLKSHYQAIIQELSARGVRFTAVNGSRADVGEIRDIDAFLDDVCMRDDEFESMQDEFFPMRLVDYQSSSCRGRIMTSFRDRAPELRRVLPSPLSGESVLDVGCAEGLFCFGAEQSGASRVVGMDIKENRFEAAMILKRLRGSNVEFRLQNVEVQGIGDEFDIVLLLNVVHHLRNPFKVIQELACIARKRLVLEFPSLNDKKFRAHIGGADVDESQPLIGVSSPQAVDQTFVFSPPAMRAFLENHLQLFSAVRMVRSTIPDRFIAFCEK